MFPIVSYGIICVFPSPDGYRFLVVQRRDSYAYVDFILGNYPIHDKWRISQLFIEMTPNEKFRLLKYSFDDLWKDFLCDKPLEDNRRKYEQCSTKYNLIKDQIPYLVKSNPSINRNTEWGFPKGRRHKEESFMHTAFREFFEETGLHSTATSLTLVQRKPLMETYRGTDSKLYKTVYWITIYNDSNPISPKFIPTYNNIRGYIISDEVSDIKWIDVKDKKRYLSIGKQNLIDDTINVLNKYYNINDN